MSNPLANINDFNSLIFFLRDELYWPISEEDFEEIFFDYTPKELGIENKYAVKINSIKQLRSLSEEQPWGIFFLAFERKKLPVVILRRILRKLIRSRRTAYARLKTWDLEDLIFISFLGEEKKQKISFAQFTQRESKQPELRTFSWDEKETYFHYMQNKLDLEKLRWPEDVNETETWKDEWSKAFTIKHRSVISNSQELAKRMAEIAKNIRDQINEIYKFEISSGPLHTLFNEFKRVLISDLKLTQFSDMYAQTITYGLFSARISQEGYFSEDDLFIKIPTTTPFLKKLFNELTSQGNEFQKLDYEDIGVNILINLLKNVDIDSILREFGAFGEDPVIHFYELFLKVYDPTQKVDRGVYYTPDPVVKYIVEGVDKILTKFFSLDYGLASSLMKNYKVSKNKEENQSIVQILDPATGTGTFIKYAIKKIKEKFDLKNKSITKDERKKKWNSYVNDSLLDRIYGFELMMAPYAVAHFKIGLELIETGYNFKSDKRIGIYLCNTLDPPNEASVAYVYDKKKSKMSRFRTLIPRLNFLTEESKNADEIKADKRITVIIGNPPYKQSSKNNLPWINALIEDYKKNLDEKNLKVLNDDYVKFIRFGQWKIEQTTMGVLSFITNNKYLDGQVYYKMRENLRKTFDEIYIVNLHGDLRKDEKGNPFDITVGVAICFLIKRESSSKKNADVYYFDLPQNDRDEKYEILEKGFKFDNFQKLPETKKHYFIPIASEFLKKFEEMPIISDFFIKKPKTGIMMGKEHLVSDVDNEILIENLNLFFNEEFEKLEGYKIKINSTKTWNREDVINNTNLENCVNAIQKIQYKGFDYKYLAYDSVIVEGHRIGYIDQICEDNPAITVTKKSRKSSFSTASLAYLPIEKCYMSTTDSAYAFLLKHNGKFNLNTSLLPFTAEPEDLFYYIFGILCSNKYRKRYNELLLMDYPHIPITEDEALFKEMGSLGKKISNYFKLDLTISKEIKVSNHDSELWRVQNPFYDDKEQRIYINKEEDSPYIEGVTSDIWDYSIGQVNQIEQFLKARTYSETRTIKSLNRGLNQEEKIYLLKLCTAIKKILKTSEEIDKLYIKIDP
ncbi:MAG: type ISP restriction/modification enzyme [Promethearchaeota archaeon]